MKKSKYINFLLENGFEPRPSKGSHSYPYLVINHNENKSKMYFTDLKNACEAIKRWYLVENPKHLLGEIK